MAFADSQANCLIDFGEDEIDLTLAGTVKIGDAIGWSSGWKRTLATVGTAIPLRCVAAEDGAANQKIKAYFGRVLISGSRFSGGTRGNALYVAEGTDNGKYTETAPSTTGDVNTIVGYMLSANEAVLIPNRIIDTVA